MLQLLILLSAILSDVSGPPADRIFINGKVWTGDSRRAWAQGLAISEGTFLSVGSNREVLRLRRKDTEIIDLKGRFVVPGFNDAHLHFLVRDEIMLQESDDLASIQRQVVEFARTHASAPWIIGRGWGYATFPENKPHKKYIDEVLNNRPVLLRERDGHMALANSKALELAGIKRTTKDPEHGRIVRDSQGEPTGELQESAMSLVSQLVPEPSVDELYTSLKTLLDRAASYGLTSVQNASFDESQLPIFDRVLAEKTLKVRFYWALPFRSDAAAKDFAHFRSLSRRYDPAVMKFGAAKGMLDGVVDAQTAVMFEPYTTGKNGIAMWKQEDLNRTAALYDREGYQIFLHAIGDKAISMALDAYEHVNRVNPPRDRRHRVEHVEVPRLSDLVRFKRLGVIASTQALFANPDKTTLENYIPLIGAERAVRANAFRIFDDAGVVQAFGSDWPVFSMEVLKGIYCAAARKTPEGIPPQGHYPENRISPEAALRHFTIDAAYASFDETKKGTLSRGKFADFVVLSENILAPPVERILRTKVLLTVMDGKDTYRSPDF